ncbi:MAG: uracil phosphoribosyltransferase [Mycoplasma sp.]|nr:uracil phosphoribosyltransferase [Mycoplasma sp.]
MYKVIDHPLIKHKLRYIREKSSNHMIFESNLTQITSLMVYEILKNVNLKEVEIETPICKTISHEISDEIILVPILRAGLGMVHGIKSLLPEIRIGHIGMYRDEETFEAHSYFYKVPDVSKDALVILVDPMLATGGSSADAIKKLTDDGFKNIILVCLVGVKEGIERIESEYPDLPIYMAALDEKLNENKYIEPGLGDAGDRIFGTK